MKPSFPGAGIRLNFRRALHGAVAVALPICASLLVLPYCSAALAANAAAAPATPSAGDDLANKRAKVAEQIAKLTPAADAAATDDEAAKIASEAADELDLLRSLDLVYLQRQATAAERANVDQEKKRLQDEVDGLHNFGPAEAKPYSFLLWEDLRDQLSGEEERIAALKSDLAAAQQMLGSERETFADAEQQRRQAREAASENKDPALQVGLARELRLAEITSSIAQETVELCRAEIDIKTARQELAIARRDFLQEKSDRIGKDVKYTEHDYQARLQELTKRSESLRLALKAAERRLHQHETQQAEALAKLGHDQTDKALIAEASEAYQLARRVDCEEITLVNQRLGEMNHIKHFAGCRYEMFNKTASHEDLVEWHSQLTDLLERFEATEHSLAIRIDEIRVDQATLFEHADDAAMGDPRLKQWSDLQIEQLRHLSERCESGLVHVKAHRRAMERFQDELEAASKVQAAAHPLTALAESFSTAWNYELAKVGDDPITVGKIVSGIFYLLVGVIVARLISSVVGRQVLPRFNLNEGAIHAIQAITFYLLCVLFSFEILKLIHVPFASFTFLGGAVAIAVGFGCQNILNNFISGLILLAEQPIRVGDHVEIDGTRGMVERIGARSTRVKTISNHELIVPNSKLLEDKVTNLTLSNNLVRTVIAVTLSRTLPIDEVRFRLLQAATSHDKVLNDPKPEALLISFSKTDVAFELHFWVKMSDLMDCRIVESDVRQAVNNLLCDTDAETDKAVSSTVAAPPAAVSSKHVPSSAGPSIAAALAAVAVTQVIKSAETPSVKMPTTAPPARESRKAG